MLDRALAWELAKFFAAIATREARYRLQQLRAARPVELARGAVRAVVLVGVELLARATNNGGECSRVEDFFDGALSERDAEAFRDHAADCTGCQRELVTLAQLRALEIHHRPELMRQIAERERAGKAP